MKIEGEKIDIHSQNIVVPRVQRPIKVLTLQKEEINVYPLTLHTNGGGEIVVENNIASCSVSVCARYKPDSRLSRGSKINGKKLWGFSDCLIPPYKVGKKRSAAHSRQSVTLEARCFLVVYETKFGIVDLIHPKDEFDKLLENYHNQYGVEQPIPPLLT